MKKLILLSAFFLTLVSCSTPAPEQTVVAPVDTVITLSTLNTVDAAVVVDAAKTASTETAGAVKK